MSINTNMIYEAKNVTAILQFPHRQLKDLSNSGFILYRVKETYQGYYNHDLGFIFHIITRPYEVMLPKSLRVEAQHCVATVKFDCLCFRVQKGDILDVIVTVLDSNFIKARVGALEVFLSREKIQGFQINTFNNCYEGELSDGTAYRIELNQPMRVRCLEVLPTRNNRIQIMCETDEYLLETRTMMHI